MLKLLPFWKERVLASIESSRTKEHLQVSEEFINLFKSRYSGWISAIELAKHSIDLDSALERKIESLNNFKPVLQ